MTCECNVSATFNIANLSPYDANDDLRTNSFQEETNDVIVDAKKYGAEASIQIFVGPVTRVRDKCFKKQLNNLIWKIQHEDSGLRDDAEPRFIHILKVGMGQGDQSHKAEPQWHPQGEYANWRLNTIHNRITKVC